VEAGQEAFLEWEEGSLNLVVEFGSVGFDSFESYLGAVLCSENHYHGTVERREVFSDLLNKV